MKPVSLADITYEQGLKLIAMRKQALDSGKIRRMTKEAMANSHMLQQVGEQVFEKQALPGLRALGSLASGFARQTGLKDAVKGIGNQVQNTWENNMSDPAKDIITKGLIGAGVGTAGGLGTSIINKDKNWKRNALMGGVAGGAAGGGLGLMTNPESADYIQEGLSKAWDWMTGNSTEEAGPSGPPKKEIDPTTLSPNEWAEWINRQTEDVQDSEIEKTRAASTTRMPELKAGARGALSVGGTGAGLIGLHNWRQYQPEVLARHLINNPEAFTPNARQLIAADLNLQNVIPREVPPPSFISRMLGEVPPVPEIPAATADDVSRLFGQWAQEGEAGVNRLTRMIAENPTYGRNPIGRPRNVNALTSLFTSPRAKGTTNEALEKVFSKGIGRRPNRRLAALALLGAGVTGLGNAGYRWYKDDAARQKSTDQITAHAKKLFK